MNLLKIFGSISLAFIIALSFYLFTTDLNTHYVPLGGSKINTSFYSDYSGIETYVTGKQSDVDNILQPGSGTSNNEEDKGSGFSAAIGAIKDIVTFVPNLISSAANAYGVPSPFISVVNASFYILGIITITYLLWSGFKSLVGGP